MTVAPYGSWVSPITAADYAAGSHPVAGGTFVGDEVWWLELRPAEGGRYAVRRAGADGEPEDVLPAPWNARTRVHEYGGGSWTTADGALVFTEFADQRLYRLVPGAEPTPLTPSPDVAAGSRYAELRVVGDEVWCVRETHSDGGIVRDLTAVPLDGSAASDPAAVRSVVGGSHFLAGARVSPDGRRLAWIAWEHPQMPWDGTELRVAELVDGVAANVRTLLGSTTESVLQPEWASDGAVYVISDRSGFWNLYRVDVDGGDPTPLYPAEADFGGALWQLGLRWYTPLDDGRLLTVRTYGVDTLAVLDPASGELTDLELPGHTSFALGGRRGTEVLLSTGGAKIVDGLRRLDLDTLALTDVRLDADDLPDARYFPDAELMTFRGDQDRDVHTVVYPPHNPDFAAPAAERPPFVAFVHGGPTSRRAPQFAVIIAFFTSRGIGVVDVNYGGSTGYGREYRDRLRGQWGVVDVEDTVAAVLGLADAGLADRDRLAIEGGSAGGWTVLSALTTSDVFACGTSFFGVAELVRFAAETHDFESRYLDGLIGPLPEARELYDTRAPLNNVAGLSCPVLLLQGLDDPIVPPSQAELFRDALLHKGIPHAYRAYEGESHGFRKRETIIDWRESELSFYGQIMGFETPGIARLELLAPERMSVRPLSEILDPGWAVALGPVADQIAAMGQFLRAEIAAGNRYLPAGENVLRAFTQPFADVRVLIVGQDPYPTPGHPIGLSFAVERDVRPIPRSLANIYRELQSDLGIEPAPHGDLTSWTQHGVLLLNRCLTVAPGASASHRGKGWEAVTDQAIRALVERDAPLVAILWGKDAQTLRPLLGTTPCVESVHPSPMSADRGFFGSKPFSRANALLVEQGGEPVDWAVQ